MLTITACIGLPGSGKTTYALEEVAKNPYWIIRVNKDDLRAMCNNWVHSKSNEHFIIEIRDTIITEALMNGKHVIVDDTNLNTIHILRFKEIAKTLAHKKVQVVIKDFRDVPIEVCIARDAARSKPVGEEVIRKMANDFMKHYTPENEITIDNNKRNPFIVLVDIDGTVACKWDRSPYDYSKVMEDTPYEDVITLLEAINTSWFNIGFVTGREESCRNETTQWLQNNIPFRYEFLKMRASKDKRWDDVIKHEIASQIAKDYYIFAVFDDRNRVVEMWRKAGIRCYQVQEWNF